MDADDARTLEEARLDALRAEERADTRVADADARIADADARIADADAQTQHAMTSMSAALAHMAAAEAHMLDADQRTADAEALMGRADDRIADAAASLAEARSDSDEYRRAVYHYTQLVRHRIANPLQAISGLAQTLEELPDLPREQRLELVTAIRAQAHVLERVSLQPLRLHPSEASLEPTPFIPAPDSHPDPDPGH